MNINKFNVNVVSMCLTLKKINKDIFIRKNINRVTNFAIKVCSHISILIKKKKKKRKNIDSFELQNNNKMQIKHLMTKYNDIMLFSSHSHNIRDDIALGRSLWKNQQSLTR